MSEDVTTPDVKGEPINVSPGGGISFDQLEAVEDSKAADAADDIIAGAKEEAAKEIASEAVAEEGEVTQEQKVKIIKALAGEDELDIPANALFKHKDQEFTLTDLLASPMAQQDIDRRYSEFDLKKKEFESKQAKFDENVNLIDSNLKKMSELAAKGQHWEALRFMAEMAGQNPLEYQRALVDQAIGIASQFNGKTEEEIQTFWANEEAKHKTTETDKTVAELKQKLSQYEQKDSVRSVILENGISEEQFGQAHKWLKDNGHMEKLGKDLSHSELTARICDFYKDSTKERTIMDACNEVDAGLLEDKKVVDTLFEFTKYGDTVEDVVDVLREYLGDSLKTEESETENEEPEDTKPKGNSSKKVAKKKAATSEGANSKAKKKAEKSESEGDPEDILGFDDIIDAYGRG